MKEDMDRLMVYRNLLAAEDHLDELYSKATVDECMFLDGIKNETEAARDMVMPKEINKEFHCLVKHYAAAYEGAREVYKVTKSTEDSAVVDMTRGLLNACLEKLWGRKLVTCERCGVEDGTGDVQREG